MTKQKHNITTIAEILIDKIEDLSKNATRLEKSVEEVQKSKIKVDTAGARELFEERKAQEKAFLSHLSVFNEKRHARLPNWVLAIIFPFILALMIFMYLTFKKGEDYKQMEAERDWYKSRYEVLKDQ